jgi:haloalkane dehalogenase
MEILRTPDERFERLPDYPFTAHYADIPADSPADSPAGSDIQRLRVHYLDERPAGDASGETVLLVHGEPSWSYLYRHMIPPLVAAGHRVVVPDLVGFGRSDKPAATSDYTYARHVDWMRALLFDHLDLRGVTFFGQDWGGLIGLRAVASDPDRFRRIALANTGLPTGLTPLSDAFLAWQKFSRETPVFDIGFLINAATVRDLSADEIAAYDAPFPDDTYKAGARIFPSLVPTGPDDPASAANLAAWEVLRQWTKPFLLCFSDSDPVTRGGDAIFTREVPGAAGQAHTTIEGAHHFLQEDAADRLAQIINDFIAEGA